MDTDVLVIGGGPVGMAAAALLQLAGVTVRVLERRGDRAGQARGSTIHPRTLEVLDAVPADPREPDGPSLAATMVATGLPVPSAHFAALPHRLSYERLDTSYPFVLMLPQSETERLLDEHLAAAGVPVETSWEVDAVTQDEHGVTVTRGDGTQARGRYLIGADGAHSTVRPAVGIGFPGTPPTQIGFGADVRFDRPPADGHHWDLDAGSYTVLSLPGGIHRLFGQEPADTGLSPEHARERQADVPDHEELRAILHRVAGDDFGLSETLWSTRTGDGTRHADRYRAGRVLLAGDAAHVHMPAGGQGLNVGVQDAANLVWKLAAELAGRAPARLVDGAQSVDAERRPVAEHLAVNTLAQSAIMTTFTPGGRALRELVDDLLARDGDTADEFRGWVSGIGLAYDPPGDGPEGGPAGQRVPDLPLADGGTLHRSLRPDRFALVAMGTATTSSPDEDRASTLRSARAWNGAATVLVRPDGYAAAVWHTTPTPDEVAEVLDGWLSPAARPVAA